MRSRLNLDRESDKLALEAEEMNQRLNALKETMKQSKAKRIVQSGRIWSSSAKDFAKGAPKKVSISANTDTGPSKPSSSSSITRPVNMSPAGYTVSFAVGCSPPPSPPSTLPTPAPITQDPPRDRSGSITNRLALPSGAFVLTQSLAEMDDPELLQYLESARASHDEHFKEVEQFTYDEEEQKRVFRQQRALEIEGRGSTTFTASQTTTSMVSTEISTSPIPGGNDSFDSDGPEQHTSEMQTVSLPNPRWDAFIDAMREATAFNYFDHLLQQMEQHETLKKVQAYQLRLSEEDNKDPGA